MRFLKGFYVSVHCMNSNLKILQDNLFKTGVHCKEQPWKKTWFLFQEAFCNFSPDCEGH